MVVPLLFPFQKALSFPFKKAEAGPPRIACEASAERARNTRRPSFRKKKKNTQSQIKNTNKKQNNKNPSWSMLYGEGNLSRLLFLCFGVWLYAADSTLIATLIPIIVEDIGGITFLVGLIHYFNSVQLLLAQLQD